MNTENCLFCRIIKGEIPSNKVYEDDMLFAFHDINPKAPVHFLIVPKEHIDSANQIDSGNSGIISHIFETIPRLAELLKIENGYRIITNVGRDGGQTVGHLHFHILAGRTLDENFG